MQVAYVRTYLLTAAGLLLLNAATGYAQESNENAQAAAQALDSQITATGANILDTIQTTTKDQQLQQPTQVLDNTTTATTPITPNQQPLIPTEQSTTTQPETDLTQASEQYLRRIKSIAPNLEESLTMAELLLALDKIKEDIDRCNDDEMLAIIKNKEQKIRQRLEAMSPENLQYLALMQRSQKDSLDTLLYVSLGLLSAMLLSSLFLATYDNSNDAAPWFTTPSWDRIGQNLDRVQHKFV